MKEGSIRLFALLALVAMLMIGLAAPRVSHALSATIACGAAASASPTATPTATPTPTLIGCVHGFALSSPQTVAGAQGGDTAVISLCGSSFFTALNGMYIPLGGIAGGCDQETFIEPVTPQTGTSIPIPTNSGTTGVVIAVYRYLKPITDGLATNVTASTTPPTGNGYTTLTNGDLGFWVIGVASSVSANTVTAPTGYNLDCSEVGNSSSNFGIAIASKQLGAAGAVAGAAGTLSHTGDTWGIQQFGMLSFNGIN